MGDGQTGPRQQQRRVGWAILTLGLLWAGSLCSADAPWLAYVATQDRCDNIHLIKADGSESKPLTNYPADGGKKVDIPQIAWSPDGAQIAFLRVEGMSASVAAVKVADGKTTILHKPDGMMKSVSGISWSPDGKTVAFISGEMFKKDVFTVKADGTGLKQLTKIGAAMNAPVWSPDGKHLALTIQRAEAIPGGGTNYLSPVLHVIKADGSGLKRIAPEEGSTNQFAWSADGSKLAFAHLPIKEKQANMTVLGNSAIHVVNADGSNAQNLSANVECHETDPAWSADGRRLVFCSSRDGGSVSIYVMDAGGGEAKRLTDNAWGKEQGLACFSPDGEKIAYALLENAWTRHLHVMQADGEGDLELAKQVKQFAWKPNR